MNSFGGLNLEIPLILSVYLDIYKRLEFYAHLS